MSGHFLHHSPLEHSKLHFKYNTLVLSIFTWIDGCTSAWCTDEASSKFVLKRQKRVFPKQITSKSLTD